MPRPGLRYNRTALLLVAVASLFFVYYIIFLTPAEGYETTSSRIRSKVRKPRVPIGPSPPQTKAKARKAYRIREVVREDGIEIDAKGLTSFVEGSSGKHPIELLIERGKRLAKAVEAASREVTSVEDSAEEYERAFGVQPPKGFETWYKFTQSVARPPPISAPQLIPFVHKPFDAFLSIPASILRERVAGLRDKEGFFIFKFVPDGSGDNGTACDKGEDWYFEEASERGKGRVMIGGQGAWSWRCNNTLNLILPFLPYMPKEMFTMKPPLEVAFSLSDGPTSIIHNTFKQRSENLGRSLKTWPKGQLQKAEHAMRWTWGWQWTCPEGAPLKKSNTDIVLNDLGPIPQKKEEQAIFSVPRKEKTFIADFQKAADFCYNPDLMTYHHMGLQDQGAGASALIPKVGACRTVNNADIVGVPLDGVHELVDYIGWTDKPLNKVFWRGSATGLFHNNETQWRRSQRERLHWFSNNKSEETTSVLIDRGSGGMIHEDWKIKDLNAAWLDVGLSGSPVQCTKEDGSCDAMAREIDFMPPVHKEDSTKYKYVIDVDGNGWSSRFRRLLAGNNVVLKSTIYPEWFSEMLIPWYHYVPLKLDYTDMYDILAFFMGAPDGSTLGRDDLAQEIADNGLRFTEEKWRKADMQSYTYLLLLEFWRLMSDDRGKTSYHGDLSMELDD